MFRENPLGSKLSFCLYVPQVHIRNTSNTEKSCYLLFALKQTTSDCTLPASAAVRFCLTFLCRAIAYHKYRENSVECVCIFSDFILVTALTQHLPPPCCRDNFRSMSRRQIHSAFQYKIPNYLALFIFDVDRNANIVLKTRYNCGASGNKVDTSSSTRQYQI